MQLCFLKGLHNQYFTLHKREPIVHRMSILLSYSFCSQITQEICDVFLILTLILMHHTFGINFSISHQVLFYLTNLLVVSARKVILKAWKFRKCKPLNYSFVSKDRTLTEGNYQRRSLVFILRYILHACFVRWIYSQVQVIVVRQIMHFIVNLILISYSFVACGMISEQIHTI